MKKLCVLLSIFMGMSAFANKVPIIKSPSPKKIIKKIIINSPSSEDVLNKSHKKVTLKKVIKKIDTKSFENRDVSANIKLVYMLDLTK